MAELQVPKLNNQDEEYQLTQWLVADGEPVAAGDAVVVVETSKAAEELEATASGTLRHGAKEGDWCRPGQAVAEITDGTAAPVPPPTAPAPAPATAPADGPADAASDAPLVTRAAQQRADELGVTPAEIAALGLAVVRTADVERLRAADQADRADRAEQDGQDCQDGRDVDTGQEVRAATPGVPLGRVQRGVARAVELSHRTIPAAYTVVRMDLGPALGYARAATREVRRPVGLAELFVQQVAALHGEFPRCFAAIEGSTALLADAPHIGVTVDLGEGLYVPCVHDAARRSLREIATSLTAYRLAATTGGFKESELTGANFVVTLHTDADIVLAVPFVFPGTVCALAVTAPAGDGSFANIGLAYDHRLINGRDAVLFLQALKRRMEALG
ncbi:2-oxo acid dehydrogenase subunit E2 [Streptacidiphilus jiangxiensis]|uniref:Dihydrolipoamide acetyltransferase component of pyruvate dehydrogenase complex n=1 Tax=Streptacidiphilus jiangxiensis TaxID=235985 RepID=A0A1H7G3P7_STRJI|nr:2-oxo acid dehydrogenase subunit E2 [Streptacidiphilus jiangxiensis]SEK31422.1 2-oxoglutarate dehydrogenase E2 component (dihydrolipoamide succinyltransferase) [Streptacidiphilus jiangxiensis]